MPHRTPRPNSTAIREGSAPLWIPVALAACVLAASAWFLFGERLIATRWGFSLDDSWIYATFARNLATGHGYSFNPGERVAGATGPLYVFVLALLYAIFWDVVLPAKILGILALAGSSVLIYRSAHRLFPEGARGPLLAGALVALSPSLVWGALSGMEISLYVLVVSFGLHAYTRERWARAAFCWALGVWIRPDGLLLALLGTFLRPKLSLRSLGSSVLAAGPVLAAFFAFNMAIGGKLLPNTVFVKSHFGYQVGNRLLAMAGQWAGVWGVPAPKGEFPPHAVLLLPAILVGAVLLFRRLPAIGAYVLGLPLALAMFGASSGAHARYLMPTIPFGIVLGVLGLDWIARRVPAPRPASAVLGLLCLGWQVWGLVPMAKAHAWNVQNINFMQRLLAERIRRSTAPGDTIAVNDVGAMGYFSGCYVVDLVGLVSTQRSFDENLERYRPKYLVIFPNWYRSHLVADRRAQRTFIYSADSTLRYAPVSGAGLFHNTICARDQMLVFARLGAGDIGPQRIAMSWY
jgi:Gpi18-like mannosyltransferase